MKFTMTGQEKRWPFNTGDWLIEVTSWADLTTFCISTIICLGSVLSRLSYNSYSRWCWHWFPVHIFCGWPIKQWSNNMFFARYQSS